MDFGLNWKQRTGPVWSPFKTQIFVPFSAFQMCTLPSVDPDKTYWESGENEASNGIFFVFMWPVKVWRLLPLKASMRRIILPLVEIKMVFPSGLNFRPVHSMSLSAKKGLIFRENEIRKYSLVFFCKCTLEFERWKWAFVKWPQIVKFNTFGVDSNSEN